MKVLVACEFSGVVRDAFLNAGHDTLSCDLLPTESPGPHYRGNVMDIINEKWDLMIAFPPCTYLAVAANRSFLNNPGRWKKRLDAVMFVWELWSADIGKICIENPKGVLSSHIGKASQYIQPYYFGEPYRKLTGLWLKNLNPLIHTKRVKPVDILYNSKRTKTGKSRYSKFGSLGKGCGKERSIFPKGIALAMAKQWDNDY